MEMLIWLGVCVAIAACVWLAAPHHDRMINSRPMKDDLQKWD